MAAHFDVDVFAARLNFYRDGADWKPFHKDSHAYGGRDGATREDFTMGASFGAERELAFRHVASGVRFAFPQRNGDVFGVQLERQRAFEHGVPALRGAAARARRARFSIIAWGRRRALSARNSSAAERAAAAAARDARADARGAAPAAPQVTTVSGGGAVARRSRRRRTPTRAARALRRRRRRRRHCLRIRRGRRAGARTSA